MGLITVPLLLTAIRSFKTRWYNRRCAHCNEAAQHTGAREVSQRPASFRGKRSYSAGARIGRLNLNQSADSNPSRAETFFRDSLQMEGFRQLILGIYGRVALRRGRPDYL